LGVGRHGVLRAVDVLGGRCVLGVLGILGNLRVFGVLGVTCILVLGFGTVTRGRRIGAAVIGRLGRVGAVGSIRVIGPRRARRGRRIASWSGVVEQLGKGGRWLPRLGVAEAAVAGELGTGGKGVLNFGRDTRHGKPHLKQRRPNVC